MDDNKATQQDDQTTAQASAQTQNVTNDEKLEKDLVEANQKIQDLTETAKRALADLQNYRKKSEEEKSAFIAFANASLVLELIPILDNFKRAFGSVPEDISKTDWFKGALQIEQQLIAIMRKQGLAEIPFEVGRKIDTNIHEAIMMGVGEKDTVIEELEKGYLLGGKVIRPIKVKVGKG